MAKPSSFGGLNLRASSTGAYGPPFAANDPSVILDFCASADPGYVAGVSTRWTQYGTKGFILVGAGATFDDVNGFTPGTAAVIQANPFYTRNMPRGTIHVKVDRLSISVSNSFGTNLGNLSVFPDSLGQTAVNANDGSPSLYATSALDAYSSVLGFDSNGSWYVFNSTDGGIFPNNGNNPGYGAAPTTAFLNSHVSANFGPDPLWAEVTFTWNGTEYWCYIDGLCVAHGIFTPHFAVGAAICNFVRIGGYNTSGGAGVPLGNYLIRRFQISTACCSPSVTHFTVGFYGDSFTRQADSSADAVGTPPTFAAVLSQTPGAATQVGLNMASSIASTDGVRGQCGFISQLLTYAWKDLGTRFKWVNAARSGHGFCQTGPLYNTGTASSAAIDDLAFGNTGFLDVCCNKPSPWTGNSAGAGCDIVFCVGSVNDINNGYPTAAAADHLARFNYLADNNSNIKKVVFIEPTPLWGYCGNAFGSGGWVTVGGLPNSSWPTCYAAFVSMLRAGLEGLPTVGTTHKVPFQYVRTWERMEAEPNKANFSTSSHPLNTTTSRAGGASQDNHPSAEGHIWYADLMWPILREILTDPSS